MDQVVVARGRVPAAEDTLGVGLGRQNGGHEEESYRRTQSHGRLWFWSCHVGMRESMDAGDVESRDEEGNGASWRAVMVMSQYALSQDAGARLAGPATSGRD